MTKRSRLACITMPNTNERQVSKFSFAHLTTIYFVVTVLYKSRCSLKKLAGLEVSYRFPVSTMQQISKNTYTKVRFFCSTVKERRPTHLERVEKKKKSTMKCITDLSVFLQSLAQWLFPWK